MATTTFTCNKDTRIADFSGTSEGAGASDFNPFGWWGSFQFRTLLGFSYSFAGMVSITSAVLHIRTSTQYYVGFGSDTDLAVQRLSASFTEGTDSVLTGTPSPGGAVEWSNQPGVTGTVHTADISTSESTWDTVTITTAMQEALAAGVFYGLRLFAWNGTAESSSTTDTGEIYSREQGSSDPYIDITYTTNVAPSAPINLVPTASVLTILAPVISFTHSDSDGDALLDYDLQVSTDNTFASVTHWNIAAQTTGVSGANVTRTYAGTALTRGVTYYWRARTSASAGILTEGTWSAAQTFIVNTLPTWTYVQPSAADAAIEMTHTAGSGVNPRMVVRWSFSDANAGHIQTAYQVVVTTDVPAAFYDSGKVVSGATSLTIPVDAVRTTLYRVTITVWDSLDEASTAVAYRRCKAQWALQEYKLDTGATPTLWSVSPTSTTGTNKLITTEYSSTATDIAVGTWYASLSSAPLARWFHWRTYLFAWSGASTPSYDKMSLTYTSSGNVPPDGWTVDAQWALDIGTRVYGTRSLKGTCNATTLRSYQRVVVEPNTDYIFSGRIKSDGNSGALIDMALTTGGTAVAASTAITQTTGWTRYQTATWNSGSNSTVYVRVVVTGAASTFAWFDALKMEASKVVTPWTPGFIGTGVVLDAGGVQIDGTIAGGAIFRAKASTGGTRDIIELGTKGLKFGGDTNLYSDVASTLVTDGALTINVTGLSAANNLLIPSTTAGAGLTIGADTNLYRSAANVLKTDDDFEIAATKSLFMAGLGGRSGAAPVMRVYTANDTWVKPAGLSHIVVEVQGGGGAGGAALTTVAGESSAGAHGAAGGYARKLFTRAFLDANLSGNVTITRGAGGTGGSGSGGAGVASSFAGTGLTSVVGNGGAGGVQGIGDVVERTAGSLGGTATGGDLNVVGGDGGGGTVIGASGGSGYYVIDGEGGTSYFGGGGKRGSAVAGDAGEAYGSGGGGATNGASAATKNGGSGAPGVVIVAEYFM